MTGSQLRTIRRRRAETQTGFAKILGLHWTTISRYERTELPIPGPVSRLATLLNPTHSPEGGSLR